MKNSEQALGGLTAIVTGAGRGIGRSTALELAGLGASVVVNDIGTERTTTTFDTSIADLVVSQIIDQGGVAVASYASIDSPEGARSLIETALDSYGRVDILANVAGNKRPAPFLEMTEQQWDELVDVHLKGAFLCSQAAARDMDKRGHGRIINISSHTALGVSSRGFSGGSSNYAAAKAGVLGLTRALARELHPNGITCNAIFPNAETRNQEAARTARAAAGVGETDASLQKRGTPEAVARFIAYLALPASSEVTGRTFFVKGSRVELFSDPLPQRMLIKEGDWTLEELAEVVPQVLPEGQNMGLDKARAIG